MKKINIFFTLFFLFSANCFSQKDTIYLSVKASSLIEDEKKFLVEIELKNYHQDEIQVAVQPIFSDQGADFGDVKFLVQKLTNNGCYDTIVIDSDPFDINLNNLTKTISNGTKLSYTYNMRELYSMKNGAYRVKTFFIYSKNNVPLRTTSEWVYFQVKIDEALKQKPF
ncbi:MAG TPA: hypothetical protein PKE30_01250 [Niabella sp.]|nr:hypothetical protein [Niabella sp.]